MGRREHRPHHHCGVMGGPYAPHHTEDFGKNRLGERGQQFFEHSATPTEKNDQGGAHHDPKGGEANKDRPQYYYADPIAAPATNPMSMRILLTLLAMNADWVSKVIDVEGAFLQGRFKNG